jgi:hypothetical protein
MVCITQKELEKIIQERQSNKELNIFLNSVNRQSLANEKLIYNKAIIDPFPKNFRKKGGKEFRNSASRFNHSQFKKLLERLFLEFLTKTKLCDYWYSEYQVKD